MVGDLSSKQEKILRFIDRFLEEHPYPPSIREIQAACGISSTSVVDYHLRALERKGYLRRRRDVSRAIELLEKGGGRSRPLVVPIVGHIAAGQPIPVPSPDAWESIDYENALEVTRDLTGGREDVFALRVQGTSMIDAFINDGDIVFMAPAATADNGEMVAVWLRREGEVTLKRFYHEGERIRLQPANEAMAPIYTEPDNVEIQGKVICAVRPFDFKL